MNITVRRNQRSFRQRESLLFQQVNCDIHDFPSPDGEWILPTKPFPYQLLKDINISLIATRTFLQTFAPSTPLLHLDLSAVLEDPDDTARIESDADISIYLRGIVNIGVIVISSTFYKRDKVRKPIFHRSIAAIQRSAKGHTHTFKCFFLDPNGLNPEKSTWKFLTSRLIRPFLLQNGSFQFKSLSTPNYNIEASTPDFVLRLAKLGIGEHKDNAPGLYCAFIAWIFLLRIVCVQGRVFQEGKDDGHFQRLMETDIEQRPASSDGTDRVSYFYTILYGRSIAFYMLRTARSQTGGHAANHLSTCGICKQCV